MKMRIAVLPLLGILGIFCLYLLADGVSAQTVGGYALLGQVNDLGVVIDAASPDRTIEPKVEIKLAHVPAVLRFRVSDDTARSFPWWIEFRVGPEVTRLTSENLSTDYSGSKVLDLPVAVPGALSVTFGPNAPNITLIARIDLKRAAETLYQHGDLNLAYFDRDFPSNSLRKRISRAIVQLKFETDKGPGYCTAFQVAPGLFLTNLHCIKADGRHPEQSDQNDLLFGLTLDRKSPDATASARVVAEGKFSKEKPREHFDYAVLAAATPEPYARDIIPLYEEPLDKLLESLPALDVYQHWSPAEGITGVKALSADKDCNVIEPIVETGLVSLDQCPKPNFKHKCDTEKGSSGSAILTRNGERAIGIHFHGIWNTYNCGLRSDALLEDLKQHYPDIWQRIHEASQVTH